MTYREYKQATLESNPSLRAEYDALASQYEIIDAVIAARLELKMTQAELAQRINTRQSNISRFESGNYNPTIEFLQKLANALGKNLSISLR